MAFCHVCGKPVEVYWAVCPFCSASLVDSSKQELPSENVEPTTWPHLGHETANSPQLHQQNAPQYVPQMQDSVMSGDIVSNVSHNSADAEVLKTALEGVGKLMESSLQNQHTSPQHLHPSPDVNLLHTIEIKSDDMGWEHELIYSPMLSTNLRNALDQINRLASKDERFPSSIIDLQSFDQKISNYLIEMWNILCKKRADGAKDEAIWTVIGLILLIGIVGGIIAAIVFFI